MALTAGASGHTGTGGHHHRSRAKQRPVTLQSVGDILVRARGRGLPPGGVFPRAPSRSRRGCTMRELTLGNLEGTLSSERGRVKCGSGSIGGGTCFAFHAPPSTAHAAAPARASACVNQANNHSLRLRAVGARADARTRCERAGVAHTGLPERDHAAARSAGDRVAFLGFRALQRMTRTCSISRPRRRWCGARAGSAAIVVVIIHAGAEGADQLHTPDGHRSTTSARTAATRGRSRTR